MAEVGELFERAVRRHQAGDVVPAQKLYEQVIAADPNHAGALCNLGVCLAQQGRLDAAVRCYRTAIQSDPNYADAYFNLGNCYRRAGRPDQAALAYQSVLKINPRHVGGVFNLGLAWWSMARWDEARQCFEAALRLDPNLIEAQNHLGYCLQRLGKLGDAITAYKRVLEIDPRYVRGYHNLGLAYAARGSYDESLKQFHTALSIRPDYAEAHNSLGVTLEAMGKSEEALKHYQRAVQLKPQFSDALNNLGIAYTESARHGEAIEVRRMALSIDPSKAHVHSNLLLTMNYAAGVTDGQLFEEHREWGRRHAEPLAGQRAPHGNAKDPGRRLVVGYVSADFRDHTVSRFALPLLENHDRSAVRVVGFSCTGRPDEVTGRMKRFADKWHAVSHLDDAALAELVRSEVVDILVDLSGHTAGNRLLTFARKPAPVQMSMFGYPNTTGMGAIDYRVTDARSDPAGQTEKWTTERLLRLPGPAYCYAPPPDTPEPGPLPADAAGHVTFASLNNPAKLTDEVVQTYAEVLATVPRAKLVVLTGRGGFGSKSIGEKFKAAGLPESRLELLPRQGRADYFALHQRVDVCLDPFPYNGGVTSCDSLWMGVPFVTLAGTSYRSRQGLSLLTNVRLADLAARSADHYVETAARLADDPETLRELRETLRDRMRESPLLDARGYARSLEGAYRRAWAEYCATA